MLALVVALSLSQAPRCLDKRFERVCGYSCVENSREAACARTPAGVCGTSTTSVACFDPFEPSSSKKPTCVSDGAAVACGFGCVSQKGHVACARSPGGVCGVSTDDVACFDPPWAPEDPKRTPTCLAEGAALACGYECARAGGQVACAQSPDGLCATSGARVVCFDPPAWTRSAAVPKPSCVSVGGALGCGYDCKRDGEKVACAQTPKGKCVAHGGAITCFDPPPVAYAVNSADVPEPTCVSHDGGVTCGFSCTSGSRGVACAKTQFGVCAENGSTCFDPGVGLLCSALGSLKRPECVVASDGFAACGYNCAVVGKKAACAETPAGRCSGLVCTDPPVRRIHSACIERAFAR